MNRSEEWWDENEGRVREELAIGDLDYRNGCLIWRDEDE